MMSWGWGCCWPTSAPAIAISICCGRCTSTAGLDRSFAAHVPEDDQTCRLIVAIQHFADALDLTVCVKGIENHEQFEFFDELDCFKGQGYFIGKPMPLEELKDYILKYAVRRGHI